MNKIIKLGILNLIVFSTFVPMFVFAQGMTNPPTNIDRTGGGTGTGITYECKKTVNGVDIYGDCDYDDLIFGVKKFFDVVEPLVLGFSVVVIAVVGYQYMISGSNPSERTKANEKLKKVAIGIFFMLAAWVIVTLITNSLLNINVNQLVPLK